MNRLVNEYKCFLFAGIIGLYTKKNMITKIQMKRNPRIVEHLNGYMS